MHTTFARRPSVLEQFGISNTTAHRHIHDGLLTRPVAISARIVVWPQAELDAIKAARVAGKSDREVRDLVKQLHACRAAEAPTKEAA